MSLVLSYSFDKMGDLPTLFLGDGDFSLLSTDIEGVLSCDLFPL